MASNTKPAPASIQYETWLRERHCTEPEKSARHTSASIAWSSLNVYGYGSATGYQKTFANYPIAMLGSAVAWIQAKDNETKTSILEGFEGELKQGEMLIVLGRPGSGCSTFLKTIAGQTQGFEVSNKSLLNYQGIYASPIFPHISLNGKWEF